MAPETTILSREEFASLLVVANRVRMAAGFETGRKLPQRPETSRKRRQLRRPLDLLFLLFWAVVERLSLIYDMDRQKFKCLVADNLESCMGYITDGDACIPGRDRHLFAVR
jgi:hypothetical protein